MSAADRSASWSLGLPWWEMPIVPLASQEPGIEIPDPEEVHAMVFKLANCLAIAAPRRTAVQQFPNSLARQHCPPASHTLPASPDRFPVPYRSPEAPDHLPVDFGLPIDFGATYPNAMDNEDLQDPVNPCTNVFSWSTGTVPLAQKCNKTGKTKISLLSS